jgi:hypothetical protein
VGNAWTCLGSLIPSVAAPSPGEAPLADGRFSRFPRPLGWGSLAGWSREAWGWGCFSSSTRLRLLCSRRPRRLRSPRQASHVRRRPRALVSDEAHSTRAVIDQGQLAVVSEASEEASADDAEAKSMERKVEAMKHLGITVLCAALLASVILHTRTAMALPQQCAYTCSNFDSCDEPCEQCDSPDPSANVFSRKEMMPARASAVAGLSVSCYSTTCGAYGVCSDLCEDYYYYYTTLSPVTTCFSTCHGYNILGQEVTCQYTQTCTKETTWLYIEDCDTGIGHNVPVSEQGVSCDRVRSECPPLVSGSCGACY